MSDRVFMHKSIGERCHGVDCDGIMDASHKIGEEPTWDNQIIPTHNLTSYLCCVCFTRIMGPATGCYGNSRGALTPEEVKRVVYFPWLEDDDA